MIHKDSTKIYHLKVFAQIINSNRKMADLTALGSFLTKNNISQKSVADSTKFSTTKVNKLFNDKNTLLYADEFYIIIKSINLEFDSSCDKIFQSSQITSPENKWESKLGQLLFDIFKPQSYLENATGIKNVRLNKLLTDINKRPYAEELYLIAKLLQLKPSQLFEYFYGNGERPIIDLV